MVGRSVGGIVGASVVGSWVVGDRVVGSRVVGGTVGGGCVVGGTVVGTSVVGTSSPSITNDCTHIFFSHVASITIVPFTHTVMYEFTLHLSSAVMYSVYRPGSSILQSSYVV